MEPDYDVTYLFFHSSKKADSEVADRNVPYPGKPAPNYL
jgi:hypothetical protein